MIELQTPLMPRTESPGGYHQQYLRVNLTNGSGELIPLANDVLRRFLGGSGLGAFLMHRERAAYSDPLSPESPLAFVFSPLVGSPLTTSAKFAVVSKSPLTDRFNDSLASSGFALAGKRAGADAIVLVGRAAELSVLVIDDGRVKLAPAPDLRGAKCGETQQKLKHRFGADYSFAVIGPAGENLVRFATISHDGRHAGRGGGGAVLGAKNIKAIAVRGNQRPPWAFPTELAARAKELSQRSFGPATAKYRELGTAANLLVFNRLKTLPTRNFQQGSFEGASELSPESLSLTRDKTRASCAACTIGCEHIYAVRPSEGKESSAGVRLEYENLFALGPLCGIRDPSVVLAASQLCDELGLDTISAGGTIAFAMECVERGLFAEPALRFGAGESLLRALEQIAFQTGIGALLSQGSRRLALHIGQGSIDFAPQVKGLEIPGYEPRGLQMMALGFAVGSRGADHNRSGAYEVDFSEQGDRRKIATEFVPLAVETEDKAALMDSLILCKFLRGIFGDFFAEAADILRLVTGWDVTAAELRQTASRIVASKKLFNIRAGWTPAEDTLPRRFLAETLADDAAAHLSAPQLQAAVTAYNRCRGWSDDGWIGPDTLRALNLDHL